MKRRWLAAFTLLFIAAASLAQESDRERIIAVRWTWLSSPSISTRVVSKSVQTLANIILRLSTAWPSNTR
jgi:hypothetical protein